MSGVQPMPCPVLLGTVKSGGRSALLHRYTTEKKALKVEKILKKGVDVDSMNNRGQTPLFCASLLGFASIAEKLLQYGANPNHRCDDLSTPVHAAVFSCNPWLLSSLLDAGGDLRLHDDQGRIPRDWAEAGAQPNSPRMIEFLKRCESKMRSLLQTHLPGNVNVTPASTNTLCSLSPLKLLRPLNTRTIYENKPPAPDTVMRCFGYGKLCIEKFGLSLGLAAVVPLISDDDLRQAEDEPLNSFMCGSVTRMTNYSWKGCRVTVTELHDEMLDQHDGHNGLLDLLVTEQKYCLTLSHPHLLLLMGVSMSADLAHTRLVYERVHVGSLFSLLHLKREEFPLMRVADLLSVVLQICEVLMYLHGRSLILRALSSHTVLIVHPGVAKVTGLGFTVPSDGTCPYAPPPVPLPLSLINWAAPEAIRCKACTGKADIYSLCALIQEIYTDVVPWGSMDPHCIRKAAELGQSLITHPAVPQPYYRYLQTGLQHRAQDRTSTLQDLCYMLRCHIREIRSEYKRSGQDSCSGFQNIPGWTTDVKQMREHDKPVFYETQKHLHRLETEIKDKESLRFSRRIHTEEEESTTATDDLCWDTSNSDITHPHEQTMSHHASLSEAVCYNISNAEKYLAVSRSISNHISSTVLNLKVSQVLLQQAERSLDNAEAAQVRVPCFDEVDIGKRKDVVEENERSDGVRKPLGPPSRSYVPKWTIDGDGEVSHYSSAEEHNFDSTCHPRHLKEEKKDLTAEKRRQQLTGFQKSERSYMQLGLSEPQRDGIHQSFKGNGQTRPTWTSEISEVVAQMTHGRLGKPLGAAGSSDSEDVEERQRHLQDWHEHSSRNSSSYQESETLESSDLEKLFKSFAGIQSDSEESANFYTISRTFNVTNRMLEDASQNEEKSGSDSDSTESPVEPSTVFYTPKHHLSNSCTGDEASESLSSDEDVNITAEVCRPNAPAEDIQSTENSIECQPAQDDPEETESITPVQSCLPDLAEIADLSSISHSPTQHQEWVGPAQAPPTVCNRGHPPCNSTPRSPRGYKTYLQDVQARTECLPHLQSLLDSSPWGSPSSQTLWTESYTTARAGDSTTSNASSAPSVLQSPSVRNVSKENTDSPSSANAEFTTASSGARHTTESSQETERPIDVPGEAGTQTESAGQRKESGNISFPTDVPESSDQPPNICALSQKPGGEENNGAHQPHEEVCDGQKTSEEDECEDKTSNLDQNPDLNSVNVNSNVNSQKSTDKSINDTERAHSTLDEDLQRILLERNEGLRVLTQSRNIFTQTGMEGKGDVPEDCVEAADSMNELGAANDDIQNHPYRVCEKTPLTIQS